MAITKPRQFGLLAIAALAVIVASAFSVTTTRSATDAKTGEEIPEEVVTGISAAIGERLSELGESKDEDGNRNKRGNFSRSFTKVDDDTYHVIMQVNTVEGNALNVERYQVTVVKDDAKKKTWKITEEKLVDSQSGLTRLDGYSCYPFKKFELDREGMQMSASNGAVCEYYWRDKVHGFDVMSGDMKYQYTPPQHLDTMSRDHDFSSLHSFAVEDHKDELIFNPEVFELSCDPTTCDKLLDAFTGLDRIPREKRGPNVESVPAGLYPRMKSFVAGEIKERDKNRKDNPFGGFNFGYREGREFWVAGVQRGENHSIGITYDNWGGFEVTFWVASPQSTDQSALAGPIFGYYTKETLENTDPYDLERRDDYASRWWQVDSIAGEVELGLDDPEMVHGNIEFGIVVKEDMDVLPFFIARVPKRPGENPKRASLRVNSILLDGKPLTWAATNAFGGTIFLPEVAKAGTKLNIQMDFATRAILKRNHAFNQMNRFGWMPFVRFADFIEEFELTVKAPSQYKVLGIGHKADESKSGGVTTTHWKADSPVVFPTIIFGKYLSDTPRFEAKKIDGTVVPVTVHVDEVSMQQLDLEMTTFRDVEETNEALRSGARGIRQKQLRPIAEQAANAINLFAEISGVDYPYGELNLVNDPAPALYGQAPRSLIYLGSFVFRGEGTMAGDSDTSILGGGGTGTAKFLKSVTAHEVGHQWWGSRVSNANGRNYWFVESLAEYFSALYLEAVFGEKEYDEQVDEWRRAILRTNMKSSVQNASSLWAGEDGFRSYQSAVYSKGPYAFHILRETFGDEKFFPFLKQFTQELTEKKEIVTLDIQRAAERALGGVDANGNAYNADLSWFFDQWIRGVGLPQYTFNYETRETEDGGYILEGKINQRVIVGTSANPKVIEGKYYRGFVDVTVLGKDGEYTKRLVVEGPETTFRLKVPDKPLEVALNKKGEILAHDVLVNRDF